MSKIAMKRTRTSHKPHYSQTKKIDLNRIKKSLSLLTNAIEKNTSSALTHAGHTTTHVKKDINRFVTKKPYRTMGVVMLASVCLGYIIHRH